MLLPGLGIRGYDWSDAYFVQVEFHGDFQFPVPGQKRVNSSQGRISQVRSFCYCWCPGYFRVQDDSKIFNYRGLWDTMICYFYVVRGYNSYLGKYDGLSFRVANCKLPVAEIYLKFIQVVLYVFGSFFMAPGEGENSSVILLPCAFSLVLVQYVYNEKKGTEYEALRGSIFLTVHNIPLTGMQNLLLEVAGDYADEQLLRCLSGAKLYRKLSRYLVK